MLKHFASDYVTSQVPSGVYKISLSNFANSVDAYSDMTTDGGGWLVIQRNRKDNVVSFNWNWTDYEEGFVDLDTEFWYSLKPIHYLTDNGQWKMRVDYQRSEKSWSYLHYNQFSVGSASEEYPLTVGAFGGLGADWFNYNSNPHNGMKFSTLDNDNDMRSSNCATAWESGWWYNDCHCTYININS